MFTALLVKHSDNIKRYINKIFSHNDIMQEAFTRSYEADIKEKARVWLSKMERGLSKEEKLDFSNGRNKVNFIVAHYSL
jgi:hypothetical protein